MAEKKRVRFNIIEFHEFVPVRNAMYSVFLTLLLALALLLCYLSSMATIYVLSDGSNNEIPLFWG